MLSLFLKKEEISRYTGRLSAAQRREYRLHFEEESVHVYFKFDADRISYIAYCEDKYGEFSVSVAGKLQIVSTDLSYALLEYVRELDESGNEAVLRRMYGNQYEALSLFLRLGPKKAKALLNASTRVDELASRIEGEKKMEELPQANIRFAVTSKSNEFEVYLKVGFDKLYVTHRVGAFIRDYFSGNAMNIQKRFVTLPKNSFSPSVESGLQFLYNQLLRNYYYNASYDVTLSSNLMVAFLFLLVGERVDFDGKTLLVDKPISVSLRIDEFGELLTEPPVSREGMCQAGKQAFSIEGNHICLYEFASAGAGELFGFFDTLRGIDTSFVADQLAKKVLPLLSDEEVKIDDGFARVHPVLRPRIEYYIGLEDEKRLSFRTKYFLGLSEVTGDEFEDALASAKAKRASFLAELQSLGFPENGEEESDDAIVSYLKTDLSLLASLCQIFISEELKKKRLLTTPNFELHTNSGEDWFEVTLYSDDYDPQELLQIYHAFVRKKKFVKFHGNYVVIEEDDPRLQRLAESFTPDEIGVELPLYQALKVPFAADETDAKVLDLLEKVENYEVIDTAGIPQQILDAMRPYQHMGIRFLTNLYRLGLSGVLSDDMGLGKTLQSFGLLSLVQEEKPILVVCPKSLIYNWLAERDKWYPDLPAFLLVGGPSERKKIYSRMSNGGKACYFVSYDTLRNDINLVKDVEFSCVLLDEGQYIANATAQKTKAVKMLKTASRFVLTGTPVQNSLLDLWSIFDFLLPGYFPPLKKFKELYGALEVASEEARKRLLAKTMPFLLGRKKKDVLTELPDKENVTISLGMDEAQQKVYEAYLAKARKVLEDPDATKVNVLAMMTRLRQICVTPALFLEGEYPSQKIDYLLDALYDLKKAGRRAIVFSSFVSALDIVGKRCDEIGLRKETIKGDTSAKVRMIIADRFNSSDSNLDVLLVSLKAGGTGLNLIGADTVFHLDPWWNLAAERQAEDRAHRIGQKNKVTVFKLVAQSSIEEKVIALQERKGLLVDLTDEASLERSLTEEDYRFLLS